MTNINKNYINKFLLCIIIIFGYLIYPYIVDFLLNLIFTKSQILYKMIFNLILYLFLITILVYKYWNTFILDLKKIIQNKKQYSVIAIKNLFLIIFLVLFVNFSIALLYNTTMLAENESTLFVMFKKNPIIVIILTVIYYPIVEGIVFRKTFYDCIEKKYIFIFVSCAVYFLFNISFNLFNYVNILNSLYYIPIMYILSSVYFKTKNLTLSIIILSLYNLFTSIITFTR